MSGDHSHGHSHGHDHDHDNHLDDMTARVMALETVLTEKGLVDPAALDAIIDLYSHEIGPQIGAGIVAKAWTDDAFRAALLADAACPIVNPSNDNAKLQSGMTSVGGS